MRNRSRSVREWGRATLVALLFVVQPTVSCNTSDSIGALTDGGSADAKSGTGGSTGGSVGTGGTKAGSGGAGTGGAKTGTGGGATDAALDGLQCVLTDVYCLYGTVSDASGCPVCAPGGGGGSASGGATGKGRTSGAGTGGRSGMGGASGGGCGSADAALDAYVCALTDVYCPYGYVLDVYGCSVCAPGGSGGTGGSLDVSQDGVITCGSATCATGEYCCNLVCSMCAPTGYGCVQGCGSDAAQAVDSNGCKAVSSSDSSLCGGTRPPHYYTCDVTMLAAPCVILSIGNIVNTFCCP